MSEEIRNNPAYYEIKDNLYALLDWARSAGYLLALASNNHEHLKIFLGTFSRLQTFFREEKFIFTSERVPIWKPQPAFLTGVLQELGRTEEGVVFIGNSPYRDAPYANRGIWTFILDWEGEWKPQMGPPLWYIHDPDIIRSTLEQDEIIRSSRQQRLIHTIFQTAITDLVLIENSEERIGTCPFCGQKGLIVSQATSGAHWHCVNCALSGNGLDFVAALLQCNIDEAPDALKNEEKLMEQIEQIKQKR